MHRLTQPNARPLLAAPVPLWAVGLLSSVEAAADLADVLVVTVEAMVAAGRVRVEFIGGQKKDTPRRTRPAGGCHGLSSTRACKVTAAAHGLKTTRGTLNCTHPVLLTLFVSRIGGDRREVSEKGSR